jgi:hypothetical protein
VIDFTAYKEVHVLDMRAWASGSAAWYKADISTAPQPTAVHMAGLDVIVSMQTDGKLWAFAMGGLRP